MDNVAHVCSYKSAYRSPLRQLMVKREFATEGALNRQCSLVKAPYVPSCAMWPQLLRYYTDSPTGVHRFMLKYSPVYRMQNAGLYAHQAWATKNTPTLEIYIDRYVPRNNTNQQSTVGGQETQHGWAVCNTSEGGTFGSLLGPPCSNVHDHSALAIRKTTAAAAADAAPTVVPAVLLYAATCICSM